MTSGVRHLMTGVALTVTLFTANETLAAEDGQITICAGDASRQSSSCARCHRPRNQRVAATNQQYRFADFDALSTVQRAVGGAARRLADRRCQLLTTEFADRHGVLLIVRLNTLGMTLSQYLATLHFVDAPDSPPCRRNSFTVAFTTPGQRTVSVCPEPFKRLYSFNPFAVEFIVIHEVLHTLGLGENPPTPQAITERVKARCQ